MQQKRKGALLSIGDEVKKKKTEGKKEQGLFARRSHPHTRPATDNSTDIVAVFSHTDSGGSDNSDSSSGSTDTPE